MGKGISFLCENFGILLLFPRRPASLHRAVIANTVHTIMGCQPHQGTVPTLSQVKQVDTHICTRFWYLSHQRAAKALASLGICPDSSGLSLLAYRKYGDSQRLRSKIQTTRFTGYVSMDVYQSHLRICDKNRNLVQ